MSWIEEYPTLRTETLDNPRERAAWEVSLKELEWDTAYQEARSVALRFAHIVEAPNVWLFGGHLPRAFMKNFHGIDLPPGKDLDFLVPELEDLFGQNGTTFSPQADRRILNEVRSEGWNVARTSLEGGMRLTRNDQRIDLVTPFYYQNLYGWPDALQACFRGFPFTYQRIAFDVHSHKLTIGSGAMDSLTSRTLRVGNLDTLKHEAHIRGSTPMTIARTKAQSLGMDLDPEGIVDDETWQAIKNLNQDYYLVMHPETKYD